MRQRHRWPALPEYRLSDDENPVSSNLAAHSVGGGRSQHRTQSLSQCHILFEGREGFSRKQQCSSPEEENPIQDAAIANVSSVL